MPRRCRPDPRTERILCCSSRLWGDQTLVDALFEGWGRIPSKVLYKLGALIVAVPVIVLLWRASRLLYVHRIDIVLGINNAVSFLTEALKSF